MTSLGWLGVALKSLTRVDKAHDGFPDPKLTLMNILLTQAAPTPLTHTKKNQPKASPRATSTSSPRYKTFSSCNEA